MKTKVSLLQTEDVLLKTKDGLLKTEENRKQDVNICLWCTQEQEQRDASNRRGWVHLTLGPPDLKQYHSWPLDASIWGVHLTKGQSDLSNTTVGHEMPLPGGCTSDHRSTWPKFVSILATRCLYQGLYVWPQVSLIWSSTTLGH